MPFEDSSAGHTEDHTPTISNATIDTVTYKYGGGSGKFVNASQQYVTYPDSADWSFGTGDFTISFWVNFISHTALATPVGQYFSMSNHWAAWFNRGKVYFVHLNTTMKAYYTAVFVPTDGVWYHFKFARNGSNFYIFKDGVSLSLTTVVPIGSNNLSNIPAVLGVGSDRAFGDWIDGYIDCLKIDKGICRHTADFTPPADEDVDNDEYTVLLLKMNPAEPILISAGDSISLSDSVISKSINPNKSDSISLVDRIFHRISKFNQDTFILADNIRKSLNIFEFENVNFQDNLDRVHALATFSDSVLLLDSQTHLFTKNLSDTLLFADSISRRLNRFEFENVNFYENLQRVNSLATFSDSVLLLDSQTHLFTKNLSDTLDIIDAIAYCKEYVQSIISYINANDVLAISDSVLTRTIRINRTDSIAITDFILKCCVHSPFVRNIIAGDNLALSDALSKRMPKRTSDNIGIIDSIKSFILGKSADDPFTISDTLSKLIRNSYTDSIAISDELIQGWIQNILLSDSLDVSDSSAKSFIKNVATVLSIADEINRRESAKSFVDNVEVDDEHILTKEIHKFPSSSLILSESLLKSIKPYKSDSISLTESTVKTIRPRKNETVSFFDRICYQISRIGFGIGSETLLLLDNIIKNLGIYSFDYINLYETFDRLFNKRPGDDVTLSDSLIKNVGKLNSDQIVIVDNLARLLSMRGLSDNVDIVDLLGRLAPLFARDSLLLSDSVISTLIKNINDVIVPQDTIVKKVFRKVVKTPITLYDALRKQVRKLLGDNVPIVDVPDIDEFDVAPPPKARKEPVVKVLEDEEWHDITSIQRRGPGGRER